MANNPLMDKDFLSQLDLCQQKEKWIKIMALDINELPMEEITGQVSENGSINIDGKSAVRRTCSFSMVTQDTNINSYTWGLNTKIKLYIGLKNTINSNYPDIIWFPQGIFIITSYSISYNTNNYTISIQGKDKMCLLNGEVGGTLTSQVDFGKMEEWDSDNNLTIKDIPLKDIIKEGVHEYAKEPWQNIVIRDLDDLGVELMEYKGGENQPLYLIINELSHDVYNIVKNTDFKLYDDKGTETSIAKIEKEDKLNKLNDFYIGSVTDYFKGYLRIGDSQVYSVAKIEYGQTVGYRETDLIYAGDLIGKQGESFTSVLDKIVNMLGNFEYFYDTAGKFIFQKKKSVIKTNLFTSDTGEIAVMPKNDLLSYTFNNNVLISSFSNNPNLGNIKNDFSIWGSRKTSAGATIPIHLRYAFDKKPSYYKNYNGKEFTSEDWDWREIIYQMALDYRKHNHEDDFLLTVQKNNPDHYPEGITGYEQYYIDLEGFWRQLYNPNYEEDDVKLSLSDDGPIYIDAPIDEKKHVPKDLKEEWPNKIYNYPLLLISNSMYLNFSPENALILIQAEKDITNTPVKSGDWWVQSYMNYVAKPAWSSNEYFLKKSSTKAEKITDQSVFNNALTTSLYIEKAQDDWGNMDPEIKQFYNGRDIIQNESGVYVKYVDDNYVQILSDAKGAQQKILYYQSEKIMLVKNRQGNGLYWISADKSSLHPTYYRRNYNEINGKETYTLKKIDYYWKTYNYYEDGVYKYWHKNISNSPESLNFWFDFCDTTGDMEKFSVKAIGDRPKVVNNNSVKSIYYRETPNVVLDNNGTNKERRAGYTYINIPDSMLSLFSVSSQGQSAADALEECLNKNTYCVETVSLTSVPIYYLEPNTNIYISDNKSGVEGEYSVASFSLPLNYGGTMTISATKEVDYVI